MQRNPNMAVVCIIIRHVVEYFLPSKDRGSDTLEHACRNDLGPKKT